MMKDRSFRGIFKYDDASKRKDRFLGKILHAIIFICLISFISACSKDSNINPTHTPTDVAGGPESVDMSEFEGVETYTYKTTLSNGFYATDVFIPRGVYTLRLISGYGEVSTEKGKESFYMGNHDSDLTGSDKSDNKTSKDKPDEKDSDKVFTEYNNLLLGLDEILHISGDLVVEAFTTTAIEPEDEYDNKAKKNITLKSGEYIGGDTIKAGVYDITLLDGTGDIKISTDVDETLSGSTPGYASSILHVFIQDGDKIEIASGMSVEFSPSVIGLEKNMVG